MSPRQEAPVESATTPTLLSRIVMQWHLVLLAISFFTRIPINISAEINQVMLSKASRYFALVGLLVGGLSALCFWGFALLLPPSVAILLTMGFSLLLTGAFHEDGWADVWDGFGGGWQVKDKLNIMKDSRLGTYGAASLIILLLLKYQTLSLLADVDLSYVVYALILGNTLSRVLATSLIYNLPYVREDALTKVKPLAQDLSLTSFIILLITGGFILLLATDLSLYMPCVASTLAFITPLLSPVQAISLIAFLYLSRLAIKVWFTRQLGGYTGDCLGAAQQLTEVIIYVIFVAWFAPIALHNGTTIIGGSL